MLRPLCLHCRTDNLLKNLFHNGMLTGKKPAKKTKRKAEEDDGTADSDSTDGAKIKKSKIQEWESDNCGPAKGKVGKTQKRETYCCGPVKGRRRPTEKQELVLDSDSHNYAQGKKRKAGESEDFAEMVNDNFTQGYTAAMLSPATAHNAQPSMSRISGDVHSPSHFFASLTMSPIDLR